MKKIVSSLPEKLFGIEVDLIGVFVVPLCLVVVFLLSIRLVVQTKINEIKSTKTQIASVQKKIKEVEEKRKYVSILDKEELKKEDEDLRMTLLGEQESFRIIGVVRNITDKYGFQVKSFNISSLKKKSTNEVSQLSLGKARVETIVLGTKDAYENFIKSIENSLPLIEIEKLDIKTSGESVELKMNIDGFYVVGPNKESINSGEIKLADLTILDTEKEVLDKISNFEKFKTNTVEAEEKFVKYEKANPFTL